MATLRELFDLAENARRKCLGEKSDELLNETILAYEKLEELVQRAGIFSSNETLEDIATSELKYLVLPYHLAILYSRRSGTSDRAHALRSALVKYKEFLESCLQYGLIPTVDRADVEMMLDSGTKGQAEMTRGDSRRDTKIRRYKLERTLQQKIDQLSLLRDNNMQDDDSSRELELSLIRMAVSTAMQEMESTDAELQILNRMALDLGNRTGHTAPTSSLERPRATELDWRLDLPRKEFLDKDGKVLRPFVITSTREQLRSGVRGYDHSLPSMSIDEYLEQETGRGGILATQHNNEGLKKHEKNNDETVASEIEEEAARTKASAWDEFVENNPKGLGNTMNRG